MNVKVGVNRAPVKRFAEGLLTAGEIAYPPRTTSTERPSPVATIISVHSFRGGTGKSNTTANLAAVVAAAGHRVGVIDGVIQSPGIHVIFQLSESRVERALNDYLWGKCPIEAAAYDVTEAAIGNVNEASDRPRIFLIPSSVNVGEIAVLVIVQVASWPSATVTEVAVDAAAPVQTQAEGV